MTPSERAAGSALSSTWKSRSQPLRSARANSASSASCRPRDHIGDRAEKLRSVRVDHRLDVSMWPGVEQRHRRRTGAWPAARCGPASARARRRRRARRSRVCGPRLSIWVRIAARAMRIGAAKRELHARRDVLRALQRAARSFATASSALVKRRRSDWARAARYGPCRDGCAHRRRSAARSGPPSGSRGASPKSRAPAGAMSAMRPSSTQDVDAARSPRGPLARRGPAPSDAHARAGRTKRFVLAIGKRALMIHDPVRCRASGAADR